MPYYLVHPEHGTHICYTPEDVEAHKALGWMPKEDNPEYPNLVNWSELDNVTDYMPPQPKKRGRKPKVR